MPISSAVIPVFAKVSDNIYSFTFSYAVSSKYPPYPGSDNSAYAVSGISIPCEVIAETRGSATAAAQTSEQTNLTCFSSPVPEASALQTAEISAATPEGAALIALIDMVEMGDIHHESTLAQLSVHFRRTPHAAVFERISAELLENDDIDETTAETLFEDTIRRLGELALRDEIHALKERARAAKLSPEEQQHLLRLLKRKSAAASSN